MTTPPPDDTFIDSLVGRPLDEATRMAIDGGWLVRPYAPGSPLTMDYRLERVNLEHEGDVVTRAWVG
ncbi:MULTISPECIES: hypothetical protein [unclassified Nocardioides]|uniref:hypothetical protein n=1 Tax=unclassified Nocardioides TaxID=2615069 RepID=UPI0036239E93